MRRTLLSRLKPAQKLCYEQGRKDGYVVTSGSKVPRSLLYSAFREWCKKNDRPFVCVEVTGALASFIFDLGTLAEDYTENENYHDFISRMVDIIHETCFLKGKIKLIGPYTKVYCLRPFQAKQLACTALQIFHEYFLELGECQDERQVSDAIIEDQAPIVQYRQGILDCPDPQAHRHSWYYERPYYLCLECSVQQAKCGE